MNYHTQAVYNKKILIYSMSKNEEKVKKIQALYRSMYARNLLNNNKLYCPHVASRPVVSDAIIELTNLQPNEVFLDIGSGEGAVLQEILTKTKDTYCVGIEIDNVLVNISKRILFTTKMRESRTQLICDDIRNHISQLETADVIFIYLLPSCIKWLAPLLKTHCKKGTRICTYEFKLPVYEWGEERFIKTRHHLLDDSTKFSNIYLYNVG